MFIINGVFKKQFTNFCVYDAIYECIEMVEIEAKERNIKFKTSFTPFSP